MERTYPTPRELKELLRQEGVVLKKKWGQHFLIPETYRKEIVDRAGVSKHDVVWEIGPGAGALTVFLAERCERLVCFELDHGIIRVLKKILGYHGNRNGIRIVPGDFCKTWQEEGENHGFPRILVGNLPYASGSAMMVDLIKAGVTPEKMVVMVQKEVGERMAAFPGQKAYSAFSLICQSAYTVQPVRKVPPQAFYPPPEVESVVLELNRHGGHERILYKGLFYFLVDGLFHARRKKAINSILSYGRTYPGGAYPFGILFPEAKGFGRNSSGKKPSASFAEGQGKNPIELSRHVLEEGFAVSGISPGVRGETIGLNEALSLTEVLAALISKKPTEEYPSNV